MQHFRPYRNLFVSIVMLVVAFSCGKFEDGPKVSLRSVEKRIYGIYHIESISKNGFDLTSFWNQYYDLQFDFHYDETGSWPNIHGAQVSGYIDSCGTFKKYGFGYYLAFSTEDNITKLWMYNAIMDTAQYPERLFYPIIIANGDEPTLFEVTRLTNREMWLRHTNGNDVYEIHFKENI